MNISVQPEVCSQPVSIPANVSETIGLLVDRAKVDRKGVFWPVNINYRQTDAARFETSLGYGTPGILLVLLEYYRCTKDTEIAELIHKGVAWVQNRVKAAPFQHGFYAGTGGQWYLWRELEQVFPGSVGTWSDAARAALTTQAQGEIAASLGFGTAGTIVGALSALDLSDEEVTLLKSPLEQLIGAARFSSEGVFWDFNTTSLRPPLGFLLGNAGVDYCLAHLRRRLNVTYPSLLAGSLARAAALFDARLENWPDQDGMSDFKEIGQAGIEKMLDRSGAMGPELSLKAEYALGWGNGLAGILQSRAVLSVSYNDNRISEQSLADCRKAIMRLSRVTEQELASLDSTLQSGLSGAVLSLQAYARRVAGAGLFLPSGLLQKAEALLAIRKPVIENEDLSLVTGTAGMAYAVLKITAMHGGRTCLDPLADKPLECMNTQSTEGALDSLLKRRLPSCGNLTEVKTALESSVVSLGVVKSAVADQCTREPLSMLTKAIKHELDIHHELSKTNFRQHFWRELAKQRRFAQLYSDGMNDNLLFERFRIDESVTLLELDFDPYTRAELENGQKLQVIRQVTSRGVIEAKLSALQFSLLSGFREGAVALPLIREVIQRVETPNVTQRQLAELSLKMVRAFVGAGYLVSESPNKIEAWMIRKRLKAMRNNLFPAATT